MFRRQVAPNQQRVVLRTAEEWQPRHLHPLQQEVNVRKIIITGHGEIFNSLKDNLRHLQGVLRPGITVATVTADGIIHVPPAGEIPTIPIRLSAAAEAVARLRVVAEDRAAAPPQAPVPTADQEVEIN